jgi:prevent-host-death family protein
MCYIRVMAEIASRQLRNETRSVLERVDAGEKVTITVDGRPVAELVPVASRDRWMRRDDFVALLRHRQADPGLRHDLEELAGEMTDDLPFA